VTLLVTSITFSQVSGWVRFPAQHGVRFCGNAQYGPDDEFFKVRADDGNLYILRHQRLEDQWLLKSFRQTA
jgi:hypothetical protein